MFKYTGKLAISEKRYSSPSVPVCITIINPLFPFSSSRANMLKEIEQSYHRESLQKTGGARRSLAVSLSSSSHAMGAGTSSKRTVGSLSSVGIPVSQGLTSQEVDLRARAEGALANEAGLTIIELLEGFSTFFKV